MLFFVKKKKKPRKQIKNTSLIVVWLETIRSVTFIVRHNLILCCVFMSNAYDLIGVYDTAYIQSYNSIRNNILFYRMLKRRNCLQNI